MAGWWRRWLGRRFGEDAETLRGRYERFQHLIAGNNRVLDLIADAGEKLGGDYLFDQRYLNWLVTELEQAVEGVVYDLNAMADGRYLDLVNTFERIRHKVRVVLSPTELTESELVIPLGQIDCDSSGAAGEKMASIGELRNKLHVPVPEGFVVTASACRRHFQFPDLEQLSSAEVEGLTVAADLDVDELSSRLQKAVRNTPIDKNVARAIRTEINRPERSKCMYAVRSSALGENGIHSFAGQHATFLNVPSAKTLDAYREVLASLFSSKALRYRLNNKLPIADALMAVGFLVMVPARSSGVVHTVDPAAPQKNIIVVTAAHGLGPTVVEGTAPVDRFELSRDLTPRILVRDLARKESALRPRHEGGTETVSIKPPHQTEACVSDEELVELGRLALRIEAHAGHHQEIEWAIDHDGQIVILQARKLRVAPFRAREDEDLALILREWPVLLRGRGVIACRGIGSGTVFEVRSAEDFQDFPNGAVLVTQSTSPRYSPLLSRANAVITKVGTPTGHLAAVAREFRIPMIVDVGEACRALRPGMDVTVDAEENVIYKGVVHELLRYHLSSERSDAEFEEFRLLRRLVRRITPLNLTDPDTEDFRARSCTTYHDVIRFAHEMAIRELVDMPDLTTRDRKQFVRRLDLHIPMDLDLLDIGGGLASSYDEGPLDKDLVRSQPLNALLRGLCAPGSWRTEPVEIDMESFLSSATRGASLAIADSSPVRPNLAVISENYMNLHLLLGYHFNMVDCHLSDVVTANYIYFRFTGGVTDITRRSRRALFIAAILEEYDFAVQTKGDLVIGRYRDAKSKPMLERLEMLGRLIGYTRQLDVLMSADDTVREHTRAFIGYEPEPIDELEFPENREEV
jgi:pyruvate,water dikinase